MKKGMILVFACFLSVAILMACSGKSKAGGVSAGKKAALKGTYWVEDYKVEEKYQAMSGYMQPVIYLNYIFFDEEKDLIVFFDDYNEYDEIKGKEYAMEKDGTFTVYLYPKSDVLAVKEKEPSAWMTGKNEFILEGKFENETLSFPSRRRSNTVRVFTKKTKEEMDEIVASLKSEYEKKKEENDKAWNEQYGSIQYK